MNKYEALSMFAVMADGSTKVAEKMRAELKKYPKVIIQQVREEFLKLDDEVKACLKEIYAGNLASMIVIGNFYFEGEHGCAEDIQEALGWYEQAFVLGYPLAGKMLGDFYRKGEEVPQNLEKAAEYYHRTLFLLDNQLMQMAGADEKIRNMYTTRAEEIEAALTEIYADAAFDMALFLERVELAEDAGAQVHAGVSFRYGEYGLPMDVEQAVKFFTIALEKRSIPAALNLGELYQKGEGVPADAEQAKAYYQQASMLLEDVLEALGETDAARPAYEQQLERVERMLDTM